MSETTKLFWGSALIAAGFGVATLFGPPEYDGTVYHPTVLSYDGIPVSGPANPLEPADRHASGDPLRLRAEQQATSVDSARRASLPSAVPHRELANPIVRPVWERDASQPQWLSPVPEVEPTSLVVTGESSQLQLAAVEQPASATFNTPSHVEPTWPNPMRVGSLDVSTPPSPAGGESSVPTEPDSWGDSWGAPERSTTVDFSPAQAGRPAYQTSGWLGTSSWQQDPSAGRRGVSSAAFNVPETTFADELLDVHIVVDGDTLPKLAERYLKDPERAWEIYRLNRDVLRSPELLPIGLALRLPPPDIPAAEQPAQEAPRSVLFAAPHEGATSVGFVGGPTASSPFSASSGANLVPVRPLPDSQQQVPEARLLQPRPIEGVRYGTQPAPGGDNTLRSSTLQFQAD